MPHTFRIQAILFLFIALLSNTAAHAQLGKPDPKYTVLQGIGYQTMDMVVQPDSTIVVVGSFTYAHERPMAGVAKLKKDGSNDYAFNIGTGANGAVRTVARQADGKLLIGGEFTSFNGTGCNRIARLNADGSLDTGFSIGTGFNSTVTEIMVQADSLVMVGGSFGTYKGGTVKGAVRLTPNGSLDNTFAPTTTIPQPNVIIRQPDGKYLIAGQNHSTYGAIRRLNANGSVDSTFNIGTGTNNSINGMVLLPDGRAYISGSFTTYNGSTAVRMARIHANGSLDTGFNTGTGFNDNVLGLLLESDGKVLATGDFTTYKGTAISRIARLDTSGTRDTLFNPGTGPNDDGWVLAHTPDGGILVAGLFYLYNGYSRSSFVKIGHNGAIDNTFMPNTGFNERVYSMAQQSNGKMLVGGDFTRYGAVAQGNIARMNTDGTLDTTFASGSGANGRVIYIHVLPDDKILIAGRFTTYNGVTATRLARLNADGSLDNTFSATANADVASIAVSASGKIFIGGSFTTVNSTSRSKIAKLNANGTLDTGTSFGGFSGGASVSDMVFQDAGKILVAGNFTTYAGVSANRLMRIDTLGTVDTAFSAAGGANGSINTISLDNAGNIVVAGAFTTYNGSSRNGVAKLQANGALHTGFAISSLSSGGSISAAIAYRGGAVIGGNFTSVNGTARNRIAYLDSTGALDAAYYTGTGINIAANVVNKLWADEYTGRILAGGTYREVEGRFAPNFGSFVGSFAGTAIDSVRIDTLVCAGGSVQVRFKKTKLFNAGNVFSAQLSDNSGSFASPIAIGSKQSGGTGWDTLTAEIPAGTTVGSGYKVRIVSTNAITTSNASHSFRVDTLAPPIAPVSQYVSSDSSYTFIFDSLVAYTDSIEWALDSSFENSHIIAASGSFSFVFDSTRIDTLWIRGISNGGCISTAVKAVIAFSQNPGLIISTNNINALSPCTRDTFALNVSNNLLVPLSQTVYLRLPANYPYSFNVIDSSQLDIGSVNVSNDSSGFLVSISIDSLQPGSGTKTILYSLLLPCEYIPTTYEDSSIFIITVSADSNYIVAGGLANTPTDRMITYNSPLISVQTSAPSIQSSITQGARAKVTVKFYNEGTAFNGSINIVNTSDSSSAFTCDSVSVDSINIKKNNAINLFSGPYSSLTPMTVSLMPGDSITVTEWVATSKAHCGIPTCSSKISLEWGCNGDACRTTEKEIVIPVDDVDPKLLFTRISPQEDSMGFYSDNSCMNSNETEWVYMIKNTSYQPAVNITAFLNMEIVQSYTFITRKDISIDTSFCDSCTVVSSGLSDSSTYLNAGDFAGKVPQCFYSLSDSTDQYANPIKDYTLYIPKLEKDEMVILRFNTFRCCPADTFLFNRGVRFNRWGMRVSCDPACGEEKINATHTTPVSYTINSLPYVTYDPFSLLHTNNLSHTYLGSDTTYDLLLSQTNESTEVNLLGSKANEANPKGCGTVKEFEIANQLFPSYTLSKSNHNSEIFTTNFIPEGNDVTGANPAGIFVTEFLLAPGQIETELSSPPHIVLSNGAIWHCSVWTVSDTLAHAEFNMDSINIVPFTSTRFRELFSGNSVIKYYLKACCAGGGGTPEISVNTYFVPDVSGHMPPCAGCKIPLSKVSTEIFMRCPGCVAPGIIVSDYRLQRTTFGYQDINDNQRPDGAGDTLVPIRNGSTYWPDSLGRLNLEAAIVGDELLGVTEAFIQEGDGSTDPTSTGFTYAEWQSFYGGARLSELYLQLDFPEAVSLGVTCTEAIVEYYDTSNLSQTPTAIDTFETISPTSPLFPYANNKFIFHLSDTSFGSAVRFHPNDRFVWKIKHRICNNPSSERTVSVNNYMFLAAKVFPPDSIYADYVSATNLDSVQLADPSNNLTYNCEGYAQPFTVYPIINTYKEIWASGQGSNNNCNRPRVTIQAGCKINTTTDVFKYEFRLLPFANDSNLHTFPLLSSGSPALFHINAPVGYTAQPVRMYSSGMVNQNTDSVYSLIPNSSISQQGSMDVFIDTSTARYSVPFETYTTLANGIEFNSDTAPIVMADSMLELLMFDGDFNQYLDVQFRPICAIVDSSTLFDTLAAYAVIPAYSTPCNPVADVVLNNNKQSVTNIEPSFVSVAQNPGQPTGIIGFGQMIWNIGINIVSSTITNAYYYIDSSLLPPGYIITSIAPNNVSCQYGSPPNIANGYYIYELGEISGNNGQKAHRICISLPEGVSTCNADSIVLPVGLLWNCDGYPDYATFNPDSLKSLCNMGGSFSQIVFQDTTVVVPVTQVLDTMVSFNSCVSAAHVRACLSNNSLSTGIGNVSAELILPDAYTITGNVASVNMNNGMSHLIPVSNTAIGDSTIWVFNVDSFGMYTAPASLIGANGIRTGENLCVAFDVNGTCNAALLENSSFQFVFMGLTDCGNTFSSSAQLVLSFTDCPLPAPVISADTANLTCSGYDTVTLVVSPSTGSYGSNITFTWSNSMTGDTVHILRADTAVTYTVTVSSDSGCIYTADFTVPGAFTPGAINIGGDICIGGEVVLYVGDTLIPALGYTYQWNTGATTDSVHAMVVYSLYQVTVTDPIGCKDTLEKLISVFATNFFPKYNGCKPFIEVNFHNFNDLEHTDSTIVSGTPPYIFAVTDNTTGDTLDIPVEPTSNPYIYHVNQLDGLTGVDIKVSVTDANGCWRAGLITVSGLSLACCFVDTGSVIEITQDTLASQISIPVGSNVYVGDSVTITVDTLWVLQQCEVVLGSAAEIVVTAAGELNVKGSYLHACDTMWQGITLQAGSLMLSQEQGGIRSVIEDAVIAILSNKGAVLHARRTDFINDRMGIIIADGGAYAGTVGLCNFEYASPGLKPPYSGKRTLSGIYMHHTSSWSVPVADSLYNTFTGINNGISGYRNFEMHVNRNMFTDISQYEGCTLPSCVAVDWNSARLGCAVFLSSDLHLLSTTPAIPMGMGQASVSNSGFRNCFKGVKASSLTIGVTQDTMTNMTYGVDISKTWYRLIAVGHNVMDTVSYGISLKNNVGSSEQVYYNQIRVRPIPTSVPLGISSLAGGTQIIPVVPVAEDYFAVKSANGPSPTFASDIYFNALRHGRNTVELESPGYRTVVRNNAIYQNGAQAVPLPQKGIYVRGGEKFRIYGDTIYGLDSAGTVGSIPVSGTALSAKRKQGIFLDAAKRYEIMCNQLDSLQWGMVFQGNCDAQEAAIHENRFNYYRRGLSLQKLGQYGSIGGAIGGLDSVNSNQWHDGSSNDVNQWETYNHTDAQGFQTSLYWSLGQIPASGTFDNRSNFANKELDPQPAHNTAITAEDCQHVNGLRISHIFDSLEFAIAADTFEFTDFAEVSKWRSQRDLYAKIMEAYALDTIVDTSLLSFANADPRDGVRQSVRYANAMQLLSDSSLVSDSLQVANLLSDAYKVLDSLPDEPSYVRNVKETGKLLIRVMARGEAALDSSELVYVENLAFSCPLVEGDGVYTARYLYGLLADTTYYIDDMLLCTEDTMQAKWEGEEPKKSLAANEERNIGSLQLVPNPTKDMVTVIYSLQPNEKALLSLYSLTGQAVIQKELVGTSKVDLNLLQLPSGLYTYKAVGNMGSLYSGKLIIAK